MNKQCFADVITFSRKWPKIPQNSAAEFLNEHLQQQVDGINEEMAEAMEALEDMRNGRE